MSRLRFNRSLIAAVHDTLMAAASYVLALYLRLGSDFIFHTQSHLVWSVPLFTLICIAVFASQRLYRGLWRYASMQDLITITKATTLA